MFKNIYVICPAFYKSGGPELLHQYVRILNDENINANIAYINYEDIDNPINPAFKKYITEWIPFDNIEDVPENIVVFPETHVHLMKQFQNVKKIIFWGSVDNYLKTHSFLFAMRFDKMKAIKNLLKGRCFDKTICTADLHFYQSEYARLFLSNRGIKNIISVSDYINEIYLNNKPDLESKEDIVVYNPKKGYKFTSKIIKKMPDIKWIPIQNMTNEQVLDVLNKSKLYIDFGNHPGKDRFPREAAMCGCCLITGKRGAAVNDVDISIPSKYKFADKDKLINDICDMIKYILSNYESCRQDLSSYQDKIKREPDRFKEECIHTIRAFESLYK